jgi:hypothetical protein
MERVSSTPLGQYLDCPRKFWYAKRELKPQIDTVTNAAMAYGTIFHAFMEFRAMRGRWPTRGEFDEMKGSYDDPVDAARKFPAQYKAAFAAAQYLLSERPDLAVFDDDVELEKPLDDFGLEIGGVTSSGFIDVFLPSQRLIRDYKTRGSFGYIPRTQEDFHADAQLCYYGAAVAFAMGWDTINVQHVNVLRPKPGQGHAIEVVTHALPVGYLRGVWEHLDRTVVPDMKRLAEDVGDELDVPVSRGQCWKYGKCAHFNYCGATREEELDNPFEFLKDAISAEENNDPFEGLI